jgi:muramidase (phage lysozyme)
MNLVKQYKFPDFSPHSQDLAAVALIVGRKAIDDVIAGRLCPAIAKCIWEWASLPGSLTGQRTESIDRVRKVYTDNGGVEAK